MIKDEAGISRTEGDLEQVGVLELLKSSAQLLTVWFRVRPSGVMNTHGHIGFCPDPELFIDRMSVQRWLFNFLD